MINMTTQFKKNIILVLIYFGMLLNFFCPFIRFEMLIINYLFALVTLFIPTYLLFQCSKIKKLTTRLLPIILLIPISLISLLFALLIGLDIGFCYSDGQIASSENIKDIQGSHYDIVAYRINPGAMSSYSIAVRQEMHTGFGFKIVKSLYTKGHKGDVDLKLQNNLLQIDDQSIQLLEHVYF